MSETELESSFNADETVEDAELEAIKVRFPGFKKNFILFPVTEVYNLSINRMTLT